MAKNQDSHFNISRIRKNIKNLAKNDGCVKSSAGKARKS